MCPSHVPTVATEREGDDDGGGGGGGGVGPDDDDLSLDPDLFPPSGVAGATLPSPERRRPPSKAQVGAMG